jgi:predicted DNA-binding transcriptional regulator AlpA
LLVVNVDEMVEELVERVASVTSEKVVAALSEIEQRAEPWRLLSLDDVCERLGRSRRTVFGYVKYKGLPTIRLDDGALRFDPDDLREWCRGRRIPE